MTVKGYQYETVELTYAAVPDAENEVQIDLAAEFTCAADGSVTEVRGFYAGNGTCMVRFLPEQAGAYTYKVRGLVTDEGTLAVEPAREGHHGVVRARGIHFYFDDGTPYYGFGTTVYALASQTDALMDETIETLRHAPFNKIRMCVFPKHYQYNHNEPQHYAFEKDADGAWDPAHPCYAFWDAFEKRLSQLFEAGIQVDLILFHPYDNWGFATMPQKDNLIYLDYLLRRFAAFPGIWWSMANEYDLCAAKTMDDWHEIEQFIAEHDPWHHLLSNHNCFQYYDVARPAITHMSWQTKQLSRIPEMQAKYGKPVCIDECCYEGNLPDQWGAISGEEMTARFWRATVRGAVCTHGETFYPDEKEIVWWAKGGKLVGKSPARIAFLRSIMESLPAPLEPQTSQLEQVMTLAGLPEEQVDQALEERKVPQDFRFFLKRVLRMSPIEAASFFACETEVIGRTADDSVILHYYDIQCSCKARIELPGGKTYRLEVIDTWNMTRQTVQQGAAGEVWVDLPGRPWMAVLATAE